MKAKKREKVEREKRAFKTLALVQIFSLVLEIFAFTFIFGMSLGGVSGLTPQQEKEMGAAMDTPNSKESTTPAVTTVVSGRVASPRGFVEISKGGGFFGSMVFKGYIDYNTNIENLNTENSNLETLKNNNNNNNNALYDSSYWPTTYDNTEDKKKIKAPISINNLDLAKANVDAKINENNAVITTNQKNLVSSINEYNTAATKQGYPTINKNDDGIYESQRWTLKENGVVTEKVIGLSNIQKDDVLKQKIYEKNFNPNTEQGLKDYAKWNELTAKKEAKVEILTTNENIELQKLESSREEFAKEQDKVDASGASGVNQKKYSFFGLDASGAGIIGGNLLEGLYWSTVAWGLVQALGQVGLIEDNMAKPLGAALFIGITAGKTIYGIADWYQGGTAGGWTQGLSAGAGALIAYAIFASQYKDTKTHEETIEFKCLAWQAPLVMDKSERAKDCNTCNTDPLKPCSEYRCKSLGQSCKMINEGTALMKCIDGSIDDVNSPGIKPFKEVLTNGYSYDNVRNRPAGKGTGQATGMSVTYNGGCLKAWTPFDFGIITFDKLGQNQPAQCKMDFNHTTNFDAMAYWMGGSNLFIENHSQRISLPGTANLNSEFPEIQNNGEYKMYVRCRNGNGNSNDDEFVVNFCIDKTPDLTSPIIAAATPSNGAPVLYKVDNVTTNIYTNEPSNCKWARKDSSYENMENSFVCSNNMLSMNAESLYTCTTTLTGIQDKVENKFYFKCQDLSPQNNTMSDSYEYSLFGTQPLTILDVSPTGTIGSATSVGSVNLEIKTDNGYDNGEATCSYSTTKTEGSYIAMFDSGNKNTHLQSLDLVGGTYTYYFKCTDLGGNTAYNQTSFIVYIDKYAPEVIRAYNLESKLKILTNENAVCKFSTTSCNFDINKEGITSMPFDWTREHWAEWKTDQTYYIKCMDEFNNQPNPESCSIIVRPYELAKKA